MLQGSRGNTDTAAYSSAVTMTGSADDNIITCGTGNDILIGGAGADELIGGAGTDNAAYSSQATINLC